MSSPSVLFVLDEHLSQHPGERADLWLASFGAGGKLLSGQDAEALYVSLCRYPLFALGFNCAAGPDEMTDNLRRLAAVS